MKRRDGRRAGKRWWAGVMRGRGWKEAYVGVQLAHTRGEDGPVDATQEAHDVGVDPARLGPQLERAQHSAEVLDVGH
jgi:hypothetical protein